MSRAALGAAVMPEGWTPHYTAWRHGGWYVHNVRYPSGAVGCVSRNYADKKWRIVGMNTGPGAEGDETYPNRDAAARAELSRAAEFAYEAGEFNTSRLWLGRHTPKTPAQRLAALAGIAQCNVEWDGKEFSSADDIRKHGLYWQTGYELRHNELATTLAMYEADHGLSQFRRLTQQEIGRRQVIAREQLTHARRLGDADRAAGLRNMEAALMDALREMPPA